MFLDVPSEVQVLGVYLPPLFVAIVAGLLCAVGIARLLNRAGLSRFFWHPPLALFSLWLLSTALIGLLFRERDTGAGGGIDQGRAAQQQRQ